MKTGACRSWRMGVLVDSEWVRTKDRLVETMRRLGFREELGLAVAKNLGGPKAMERMISYLVNVKPKTEELVVDEMLAICSEIAAWREKKASEEANARYNEMLFYRNCSANPVSEYYGLDTEDSYSGGGQRT